jgi:hypothetical protein
VVVVVTTFPCAFSGSFFGSLSEGIAAATIDELVNSLFSCTAIQDVNFVANSNLSPSALIAALVAAILLVASVNWRDLGRAFFSCSSSCSSESWSVRISFQAHSFEIVLPIVCRETTA